MKDNQKNYWKGIEELHQDPEFLKNAQNEFPEFLPVKEAYKEDKAEAAPDRRDFLKLLGFSVAAVSLAACESPVKRAIPYLNKPEEVEPGIANWYASSFYNGSDYCSVLVKTREGRPIKIEGNNLSSITKGGTSARAQASVLSLYDVDRLTSFYKGKEALPVSTSNEYTQLDAEIMQRLERANAKGIRIISNSIFSPSTLRAIEDFKRRFPNTRHIQYDAISVSAIRQAYNNAIGRSIIPSYDFSKADVIVSFECDFLGTWISPVEFAGQYANKRRVNDFDQKQMARHYQFESTLSLTGCNADHRTGIKPSEEASYLAAILKELTGNDVPGVQAASGEMLNKVFADLKHIKEKAPGRALVVSGTNDVAIQSLVIEINNALNSYGSTINVNRACNLKKGNEAELAQFVTDAQNDRIGAVIFFNSNPVYDFPMNGKFRDALAKVGTKITFSDKNDETAQLCDYICPGQHYLESWNDLEPYEGFYSLTQPTITPIFRATRAAQASLLTWSGINIDYYTYMVNNWRENILTGGNFQTKWDSVLRDGVYEPQVGQKGDKQMFTVTAPARRDTSVLKDEFRTGPDKVEERPTQGGRISSNIDLASIGNSLNQRSRRLGQGIELKVYETVNLGDGSMANNPWLLETPDPVTKVTWENYLSVPYSMAKDLSLVQGDEVTVNAGDTTITIPVAIQPGQARDTVAVSVGFGRLGAGKAGDNKGVNAFPMISVGEGGYEYYRGNVTITKTGKISPLASTQTQHTVMERETVVKESNLSEFQKPEWKRPYRPVVHTPEGPVAPGEKGTDLWYRHDRPNHQWGMVIDLNTCIGCNACVVSCIAENNVPVVGKDEVMRRRDMLWLRIDRYYSSEMTKAKAAEEGINAFAMYDQMEHPAENPEVVFQPMLCQHCNHAPCESVCPVAATLHSSEGLNQMVYNRCIGTRYCANNCPYKVRRFNWFKYFDNDQFASNVAMSTVLGKMVLNPDVTVRSRGVMEKCSFCVQRIQEGKLKAKMERRRPVDGEIRTACATACPTNAITFGDYNDTDSRVYKAVTSENRRRAYTVLEELNTRPNIAYLTKIRNKKA